MRRFGNMKDTCVQLATGEVICWGKMIHELVPGLDCPTPHEIPAAHGVFRPGHGNIVLQAIGKVALIKDLDTLKEDDSGLDFLLALENANQAVLRADGTVWMGYFKIPAEPTWWGPHQLTAFEDIVALSMGLNGYPTNLFGVRADGHIVAWGDSDSNFPLGHPDQGQLYLDQDGDFTPHGGVEVTGIEDAIAVAGGFHGGCALHADRRVSCWGLVVAPDGTDQATWQPVEVLDLP